MKKNISLQLLIFVLIVFTVTVCVLFVQKPFIFWCYKSILEKPNSMSHETVESITNEGVRAIPYLKAWLKSPNKTLVKNTILVISEMRGSLWPELSEELHEVLMEKNSELYSVLGKFVDNVCKTTQISQIDLIPLILGYYQWSSSQKDLRRCILIINYFKRLSTEHQEKFTKMFPDGKDAARYLLDEWPVSYLKHPIHIASENGYEHAVELLIANRASIHTHDGNMRLPIHSAIIGKNANILKLLLEHGANVNSERRFKLTPLHDAVSSGQEDFVNILLNAGADVNKSDSKLITPLQLALLEGFPVIAVLLIGRGADVNSEDIWGRAPLILASAENYNEVIKLLVNKGANVNAQSGIDKKTILHFLVIANNIYFANIILAKGANPNILDCDALTPLDYAKTAEMKALLGTYGGKKGKELKKE